MAGQATNGSSSPRSAKEQATPDSKQGSPSTEYFKMSEDPVGEWYAADADVQIPPRGRTRFLGWRHLLHDALFAWGVAALACAVCLGLHLQAGRQAEALRTELQALERLHVEQTQQYATLNASCVTQVRATPSGWQLVRADGSDGGLLDGSQLPGKSAGVPAQAVPLQEEPRGAAAGAGAGAWQELPIRMGGASAKGAGHDPGELGDLMCQETPRAEWAAVKASVVKGFGAWDAGLVPRGMPQTRSLLDTEMDRLQAVHALADECGMGRLCMSMLAVLTGDDESSLQGARALHAPLLSLLLELPWSLTVYSGWPLFGLLAQLHLHLRGRDDVPTSGRQVEYFNALREGLEQRRPASLAKLGATFLEARSSGGKGLDAASVHAMPVLCALASQLLGDDLSGPGRNLAGRPSPDVEEALRHVQGFFRQSVQSIEDLHASVVSAWPLYSVLHAATLALNGRALT